MEQLVVIIIFIAILLVAIIIILNYWNRTGTLGRPCSDNCVDPYICDTTTQTCRLKPGSRCTEDSECTSNAKCKGAVCVINLTPSRTKSMLPTEPSSTQTSDDSNDTSLCMNRESSSSEESYHSISRSYHSPSQSYESRSQSYDSSNQSYENLRYASSDDDTQRERSISLSASTHSLSESRSSISQEQSSQNEFVDATKHNGDIIMLLDSTTIMRVCADGEKKISRSNVSLQAIESFSNNIYSISQNGFLLVLMKKSMNTSNWSFQHTPVNIHDCTHMSCAQDGNHFWIQNRQKGVLLNRNLQTFSTEKITGKRVYGRDRNSFVDIQENGAATLTIQDLSSNYEEIEAACFNEDGNLTVVKKGGERNIKKIKILDGKVVQFYE